MFPRVRSTEYWFRACLLGTQESGVCRLRLATIHTTCDVVSDAEEAFYDPGVVILLLRSQLLQNTLHEPEGPLMALVRVTIGGG